MGKFSKALNKIESTFEPDYTSSQQIKKSQSIRSLTSAQNEKVINGAKTASLSPSTRGSKTNCNERLVYNSNRPNPLSHVPMEKTSETKLANELVSAFTDKFPREELIIFVAGTEGMVPFCQNLLEQYDQGLSTPLVRLTNNLCTTKRALPGSLYEEVRKVLLALNKFYDASRNQYEILDLSPDATTDEVYNAYRTLSNKYHPDSTGLKDFDPRKFHEINGAYHSLIAEATQKATNRDNGGREKKVGRNEQKEKSKTKFLTKGFIVVAILAGASVYVAQRNNSKVISDQLQTNTFSSILGSINSSNPQPGKIQPTSEYKSDISGKSLEIPNLVKEYAKLYSRKDLEPLLALFTETATENGNALSSEIDQYKSLFTHVKEIKLTIENVSWTENKDGYLAQGTFVSNYAYNDEIKREHTGDISFLLTKQRGTLKIQSINYVYL